MSPQGILDYGALVIGNIPLLYLLNTDWFATLTQTLPGKIVTAVCGRLFL